MPEPRAGESKKDYIGRCIPMLVDEGKPQDQAVAICYSMWKQKKESRRINMTDKLIEKYLVESDDQRIISDIAQSVYSGRDIDSDIDSARQYKDVKWNSNNVKILKDELTKLYYGKGSIMRLSKDQYNKWHSKKFKK